MNEILIIVKDEVDSAGLMSDIFFVFGQRIKAISNSDELSRKIRRMRVNYPWTTEEYGEDENS